MHQKQEVCFYEPLPPKLDDEITFTRKIRDAARDRDNAKSLLEDALTLLRKPRKSGNIKAVRTRVAAVLGMIRRAQC